MVCVLKNLIGLDREELNQEMLDFGEKAFRAKQLWHWIYHQGTIDFLKMTTLSKSFRTKLSNHYCLDRPKISREFKYIYVYS